MRFARLRVRLFALVSFVLLALPIPLVLEEEPPLPALEVVSSTTLTPATEAPPQSTTITRPEPARTTTTTLRAPASTTSTVPIEQISADVLVYGTTSAGVGAVRALELAAGGQEPLSVALVSAGRQIESPLAQGLGVEDAYGGEAYLSGFYLEFRQGVIGWYQKRGREAHVPEGRLHYEPEPATEVLRGFLERPQVSWHTGYLIDAQETDEAGERWVLLKGAEGGFKKIQAKYLIDASAEGDLGRLLGADYMIGRSEELFNDKDGRRPPPPSKANNWQTAPQALSMLLTLELHDGTAPPLAAFEHPWYEPASFAEQHRLSEQTLAGFAESWSIAHALPSGTFELNEAWSDYMSPEASFEWVLYPERRGEIRREMANWVLNRVRYLQENGYSRVGISIVPARPYVREGVRFYGEQVYRGSDIDQGAEGGTVVIGAYARYDRHDAALGSHQDSGGAVVRIPLRAMMPKGRPFLLTPTAISSDESAYCSAVRMEPVRANMGAAAGVAVALAERSGLPPAHMDPEAVRAELRRQGHRLSVE